MSDPYFMESRNHTLGHFFTGFAARLRDAAREVRRTAGLAGAAYLACGVAQAGCKAREKVPECVKNRHQKSPFYHSVAA